MQDYPVLVVELDIVGVLSLVKYNIPIGYNNPFYRYGRLKAFEKWEWDDKALNNMDINSLYNLYLELRKWNKENTPRFDLHKFEKGSTFNQ